MADEIEKIKVSDLPKAENLEAAWLFGYQILEGILKSVQIDAGKIERIANKTATINAQSTATQYPNAAAVHAALEVLRTSISGKQNALGFTPENIANKVSRIQPNATHTQYPSAAAVYEIYRELREYLIKIIIPTYSTSDLDVYLESHYFGSWQEIILEGYEQYREVRFNIDTDGVESVHKITNNTGNTVYLWFNDGSNLCIDRDIYENGLEIEPDTSAEISLIVANNRIEVMAVANRINV